MSRTGHQKWTAADRDWVGSKLRESWSMGKIAGQLQLSRNAVIGRIHRDPELSKIARRHPPKISRPASLPPPPPKLCARPHPRSPATVPSMPAPSAPPAAPALPKPEMRLVPLIELRGTCKFPVGEDPAAIGRHLFCGAPARGAAYCPYHAALARGERPDRRERRR